MPSQLVGQPLETHLFSSSRLEEPTVYVEDNSCLTSDVSLPAPNQGEIKLLANSAEATEDEQQDTWNRYEGSRSTWRDWTAGERQVAQSIDQLRAQDLSIHLFNTHALRVKARRERVKLASESKHAAQKKVWEPPMHWAVWPLETDLVPREGADGWFIEDEGELMYRKPAPKLSSRQVLEELLISIASRKARERFQARPWEDEAIKAVTGEFNDSIEGFSLEEDDRSNDQSQSSDESISGTLEPNNKDSPSKQASLPSRPASPGNSRPESRGSFRALSRASSTSRSRSTSASEGDFDEPVPMSDDSQIALLLRGPARHVLARLDSIFAILHHSRQSYAGGNSNSQTESEGETNDENSEAATNRNTSRTGSSRNSNSLQRRKRQLSVSSSSYDSSSEHSGVTSNAGTSSPTPTKSSQSRQRSRGRVASRRASRNKGYSSREASQSSRYVRPKYILRNWSDVLGTAAISGWDMDVVSRAQKRCEGIFEERMHLMKFDSLGETQDVSGSDLVSEVDSEDEIEAGVHVDGFLRPMKGRRGWRGRDYQKRARKGSSKCKGRSTEGMESSEDKRPVGRPRKVTIEKS